MRLVLLTNILTPFRIHFYDLLYEECQRQDVEFSVLVMAAREPGRVWEYEAFKRQYTTLLKGILVRKFNIDWIFNTNVASALRALQPDIVVCAGSYLNPSVWRALSLARAYPYKILFWSESHLQEQRNYGTVKLSLREKVRHGVLNRFDGFWFAGKLSRQFLERYLSGSKEYIFVPNLVEDGKYYRATRYSQTEKDAIKRQLEIPAGKKVLLCPARLSPEKGHLAFLRLVSKTPQKENLVLLLSGEGPLREDIRQTAEQENLDVRLLGFQGQDAMIRLYAIADLFVLPSLSDPNPLTCIEACWAGKPLLVSEHVGNNPELVQDGKNGAVFGYQDQDAAVKKIETLLEWSPEQLENAGRISLEIAQQRYNSEQAVHRIVTETLRIVRR